jgi:UDP-N-acetyl-D-glucosamine dehydrogenase
MSLIEKFIGRTADITVLGMGYVGLPLAVAFAEAGFRVTGLDIDQAKVDAINNGKSYIRDVPPYSLSSLTTNRENPHEVPLLQATTKFEHLANTDVVVICVPTPLGKTRDPDLAYVISSVDEIARNLHSGMLVVLESTTYPGTTEEVVLPKLHTNLEGTLKVGEDFYLAFSPERIDPGSIDSNVLNTPKIVSGITENCLTVVSALYECIIDKIVPVSTTRTAEMVKLLENTYRAVNIALVNEMASICERLGVDIWEIIDAAATKPFGYTPFYPGPGLGGHCIPIDPQYLAWKLRTLDYEARFIQLASEINLGMPQYVVDKVSRVLSERGTKIQGARIIVLGVAYKANVSDTRESPALDIIEILRNDDAEVVFNDPLVNKIDLSDVEMESTTLDAGLLARADCVIIATSHSSYDWNWIISNSSLIMDTRNATGISGSKSPKVIKL